MQCQHTRSWRVQWRDRAAHLSNVGDGRHVKPVQELQVNGNEVVQPGGGGGELTMNFRSL